jgi:hypothetical protein
LINENLINTIIFHSKWLVISHLFFVEKKKNLKGLGDYPQQAGDATTYVASKANACQTTILLDEI